MMTRMDETPLTIEHRVLAELHSIHTIMKFGMGFALFCMFLQAVALYFVWVTFSGPFRQLDELAHMNQAIITATCDSTFYSPDEMARRTPMQARRLQLVCASRRQFDSLTSRAIRDAGRIP